VFTGRFGPGAGEVLFDRICRENGIKHILTAPRSPTTTGKVERWHKTMRRASTTTNDAIQALVTLSRGNGSDSRLANMELT
jgi:transposase InsO family protein